MSSVGDLDATPDAAGPAADGPTTPDTIADVVSTEGNLPPDAVTDVGIDPPCAPGAASKLVYAPNMQTCVGPVPALQCVAELTYCNTAAGWHMCTATEFRTRGGTTTPAPPSTRAWLKACIRDGASPFAPKDALCQSCVALVSTSEHVRWLCPATSPTSGLWSASARLAVITTVDCGRVGVDSAATQAFWGSRSPGVALSGAVCCK